MCLFRVSQPISISWLSSVSLLIMRIRLNTSFESLSDDYKQVINQLEGRDTSPSLTEIHEKLLNHQAKLLTILASSSALVPVSVNTATTRPRYTQSHPHQLNAQPWNNNSANSNNTPRQDQRFSKGYQGKCQLCGVYGHSARRCSQLNQHSSFNKPQPSYPPWQPFANVALASSHPDAAWLMDSGATHHMTSDLYNLSLHQPYQGNDSVLIWDGFGLSITHIVSLSLPSSSRPITLNHVFVFPIFIKTLWLSIVYVILTRFLLNSFPYIFRWRISARESCCSKARLEMSFMSGKLNPLHYPRFLLPHHQKQPSRNGTIA